jgi:transcription elongation factor Elf1
MQDPQVGSVSCNICGERFSTKIHKLSEAIDVYSEWIDACEAENA